MRPRLLLFDIDGTLIRDDGAAREAYSIGLKEVFDFDGSLKPYDFSGRTDPQITHMVLGDAGFEHDVIESKLERLWEIYTAELQARASRERVHVLPGIQALLETLADDPRFTLALLTGNIEPGARIKLAPHDLNRHFEFGAFGSDSGDRTALPPIAVRRARERLQREFEPRDVVVIGDSIYDVRCGVPHDATTIAVTTGKTPADVLQLENPDHLFETLEPNDQLLAAIRG